MISTWLTLGLAALALVGPVISSWVVWRLSRDKYRGEVKDVAITAEARLVDSMERSIDSLINRVGALERETTELRKRSRASKAEGLYLAEGPDLAVWIE